MKNLTILAITCLVAAGLILSSATAAEKKKPTPYPLKTCVVTDEEINDKGEMKPYSFVHEGHEVKLCCKSCLKDFKKDTAKYMAKIAAAEKKSPEKKSK